MNALLVITICCFFALFVTALVVASHVRVVRADPDEEHDCLEGQTYSSGDAIPANLRHRTGGSRASGGWWR